MDKFYFFKVILSYYNDDTEEFIITPEQDEADELGVPFSVSDLQKTPEFKDFIKRNKAGIIDAEYIEYAVAADSKNPITTPITAEMFAEFEQLGALEIVDSNQIVVAAKSTSMGGGKMKLWCMIGAAAVALGVLAAAYALKREEKTETSNVTESAAVSEVVSDVSEDSAGGTMSEIPSDTSVEISAETSADISDVVSEETTETSTADSSEPDESSVAVVSSVNSIPVQTPPASAPPKPAESPVETDNSGAVSKPVNKPDTSDGSSNVSSIADE